MKLTIVAGARPNFMKIAPIIEAIKNMQKLGGNLEYQLVHTGQHFDRNMSGNFFEQLGIPDPDANLECGGGSHAEQAASIMVKFEKYLVQAPTNLVIVVGDVTSTMACTIVAKKLGIDVAHVEGGIRSGDMSMPEEINRMVTDAISDYFFTTTRLAGENLIRNGIGKDRIFFVGNTMIDTLLKNMPKLTKPDFFDELNLKNQEFFVLTLHRPSNVDSSDQLNDILTAIMSSSRKYPVVFPVHPRTAKILASLSVIHSNFHLVEPLGYLEFNYLVKNCMAVVTDSGGITEEATVMGIPCITLRNTTERPETVLIGTNELIGTDPANIKPVMDRLFSGSWKKGQIPELWDGRCGERIVSIIDQLYN